MINYKLFLPYLEPKYWDNFGRFSRKVINKITETFGVSIKKQLRMSNKFVNFCNSILKKNTEMEKPNALQG